MQNSTPANPNVVYLSPRLNKNKGIIVTIPVKANIIESKLNFIIVDKQNDKIEFPASIRFSKIDKFLQKNFIEYEDLYKYKILKKINE